MPVTAPGRRVSQFAEEDYLYGAGPLMIRIERVDWSEPTAYDGENWFPIEGVEMTADGREVGRRQVLVRGRRLAPPRRSSPAG
jgi:hypothetical protein